MTLRDDARGQVAVLLVGGLMAVALGTLVLGAVARGLATSHLTAIAAAADGDPSTDRMPTISNGAANPNG